MNQPAASFGLQSWTDLETAADVILRIDRTKNPHSALEIDLLGRRDAARREIRRKSIAQRNIVVFQIFFSPASILSAEEMLIWKEQKRLTAAALSEILRKFDRDRAAKAIIVTAILGDISFFKTKELAAACNMREDMVRAAKERLKYFVRKNRRALHAVAA